MREDIRVTVHCVSKASQSRRRLEAKTEHENVQKVNLRLFKLGSAVSTHLTPLTDYVWRGNTMLKRFNFKRSSTVTNGNG